jgi:hypothetical protein
MATPAPRRPVARRGGLRTRLLLSCLIPVLLLAAGGFLLLGVAPHSGWLLPGEALIVFAGLVLLALLLATGLALNLGDRVAGPVAWLLRMMEGGQLRLVRPMSPPASDWEIDALTGRVAVLLRQNLSGARAMQELDTLRSEMGAILEAAAQDGFDPDAWRSGQTTHALTRRLLDYFRRRRESLREATDGLTRLQGLLEQDWREETQAVDEIAKRSERCFLEQTEMALELERIDKLARPVGVNGAAGSDDGVQALIDLRVSLRRWRRELDALFDGGGSDAPATMHLRRRLREWDAWVDESLSLLEGSLAHAASGNGLGRLAPRLERAARGASKAGQEVGALSCEAAQLQRNWARLGERLRSLLARVGEVHEDAAGAAPSTDGGTESDGSD